MRLVSHCIHWLGIIIRLIFTVKNLIIILQIVKKDYFGTLVFVILALLFRRSDLHPKIAMLMYRYFNFKDDPYGDDVIWAKFCNSILGVFNCINSVTV